MIYGCHEAKERFEKALAQDRYWREQFDKIQAYIDRSQMPRNDRMTITLAEMQAIKHKSNDLFDMIYTAYQLGRARGYRQAKLETKKRG